MKHLMTLISLPVIMLMTIAITGPVKQPGIHSFSNTQTNFIRSDTAVPIKIQLEKKNIRDMHILFIKDTAVTTGAISGILGKSYGELMQFMKENKLPPLKFMAWYYSIQPPWPMDVAVETESIPLPLTGRIQSRMMNGGEVIIAHMWGPYDQVGQAYEKIESWLKENHRKAKDNPFEVYLNDPSAVKSPSEIRTDIYQPIE